MTEWLTRHEPAVRLGAFAGVFLLMTLWEFGAARRQSVLSKPRRWFWNLALVVFNTGVLRLLFPAAAVGAALFAKEQGWGALNWWGLPEGWSVLVSVILLDLAIYLQHVLFHAVPALWRLHMVHHADLDFDVTTGLRFHPVEILLSMGIKCGLVLLIGAPAVGVLIFEVLLNLTSMFNHSNVRLPAVVDAGLRWVVVTPDMHRVHHSIDVAESNSNFGFNLPWWDRLLGTYRAQPEAGHDEMTIGVRNFQERRSQGLLWMLLLPLRRSNSSRSMDRGSRPSLP